MNKSTNNPKKNQPKKGLNAALKKGNNYDTNSCDSAIQSCPLKEEQVFIVPTRYACSEESYQFNGILSYNLNKTHNTAIRKIRPGYLYLWQASTGLRQFTITEQGSFVETAVQDQSQNLKSGGLYGLMLQANEEALLCYIEGIPLDQENTKKLSNSASFRKAKMRSVNLEQLKLGANDVKHTIHINESDQVIAELLENKTKKIAEEYYQKYPDSIIYRYSEIYSSKRYEQSEATLKQYIQEQLQANNLTGEDARHFEVDLRLALYRYNKEQNLAEGIWSTTEWNLTNTKSWLDEIKNEAEKNRVNLSTIFYKAKTDRIKETPNNPNDPEYKKLDKLDSYYKNALPAYFIVLDDPIGMMADIEKTQNLEIKLFEAWQAKHSIRTTIAQFIKSLTTQQGSELASRLAYKYKGNAFKPTNAQADEMLMYAEKIEKRYEQYIAAFDEADRRPFPKETSRADISSYIEYRQAGLLPSRPYQHGKLFQKIVEPDDPLDISVDNLVASSRDYIPPDIFTNVWDDVIMYVNEKKQNMAGSHSYAQVDKYIRLYDMELWLKYTVPDYDQYQKNRKDCILADRLIFQQQIFDNVDWRIDFTREDHSRYLDSIGERCFMLQSANDEGNQQIADKLINSNGADIFSLLITRGIPITERFINYGSRIQDFVTAIGAQSNTTLLNLVTVQIKSGKKFTIAQIIEATDRAAKASSGSWGTMLINFSGALLKLTTYSLLNLVDQTLNGVDAIMKRATGSPLFNYPFPMKALPAMIMAKFTQNIQVIKQGNFWKVVSGGAEAIQEGVNDFVKSIHIPKAAMTVYKGIKSSGGIVAMVMLIVNARNAYNYAAEAEENPNQSEEKQVEALSAYLYAGSALTGVLAAALDSWLVAKGLAKSILRAITLTGSGAMLGLISGIAAYKDFQSLSIRIAEMGNSVDPALVARQWSTIGQMTLFGAQVALSASLALSVLMGGMTGEAAIALFSVWMGPIGLAILVVSIIYFLTWYFERTPLQNFLAKCCWSKTPKYPDQTAIQLEEDLTDLIELLFKPTLTGTYEAETIVKGQYGKYVQTENQFWLENIAIYLPSGEPQSTVSLTLKGMINKTQQPQLINNQWLERMYSEWIPAAQGQGLVLKANIARCDVRELEIALQYSNPLITLYNKQLMQQNRAISSNYYYRIRPKMLNMADAVDITGVNNCHYLTEQDPSLVLTEQDLDPIQNNKFKKGYTGV